MATLSPAAKESGKRVVIVGAGFAPLKGWAAWVLRSIVHVYLLVGFEKRLSVTMQCLWRYATYQRGARLIIPTVRDGISDPINAPGQSRPPAAGARATTAVVSEPPRRASA